jgi:hypothetical protein
MINALPTAWTIRGVTLLVIALCVLALARGSPTTAAHLWGLQGDIVIGVNALVLALTFPPIFRFVHRWTWAHLWWFPLLDGKWNVELWSNWPRVQAMLSAARGDAPSFDALTEELPPETTKPVHLEATITSSLFEVQMEMCIPGTERGSKTVFMRPQWRRPERPCITYVYEQVDHALVPVTDVPRHLGAGVLTYHKEADELRGEYWTQRQASKGLNTAGTLILKRSAAPH